MRRRAAIRGFGHPFIAHANFRAACVYHGLDGYYHALLQPRTASRVTVVRQIRFIVHLGADTVPHKLSHHGIAILLYPTLYRVAYVAKSVSGAHFINSAIK